MGTSEQNTNARAVNHQKALDALSVEELFKRGFVNEAAKRVEEFPPIIADLKAKLAVKDDLATQTLDLIKLVEDFKYGDNSINNHIKEVIRTLRENNANHRKEISEIKAERDELRLIIDPNPDRKWN